MREIKPGDKDYPFVNNPPPKPFKVFIQEKPFNKVFIRTK
jgi:hypothetical protein